MQVGNQYIKPYCGFFHIHVSVLEIQFAGLDNIVDLLELHEIQGTCISIIYPTKDTGFLANCLG